MADKQGHNVQVRPSTQKKQTCAHTDSVFVKTRADWILMALHVTVKCLIPSLTERILNC